MEQQKLIRLVEEWDLQTGISLRQYCKNNGIPHGTLYPYCRRDSKRRPLPTNGEAKPNHRVLIPDDDLHAFVKETMFKDKSFKIQKLKKDFKLKRRQADNQYYNRVKPLLPLPESYIGRKVAKYFVLSDKIFCGYVISYDEHEEWWSVRYDDGDCEEMDIGELELAMNLYLALSYSNSFSNSANGQYLVYHLRDCSRFCNGWDPNSDLGAGQKAGHPLRNHQPASVKDANRGVTDGLYFAVAVINVAISVTPHDNDLIIVHKGLDRLSHGSGFVSTKADSDTTIRMNGVDVIDVSEDMARFGMGRRDDGVFVFRSGTTEAGMVSMTSDAVKQAFLHFLVCDERCKGYLSADAGRDVGSNVYRYDLLFNQAQGSCDQYSDADGNVVLDGSRNPLRVPFLKKTTEILRFMTDEVKEELTSVLTGMDRLTEQVYPDAFPDVRRRDLVRDYFVRDYLGNDNNITLNWEYVGFIARRVTDNDRLAMHLDTKNDWRSGYNYCTTYSYVIDGYRVTIIACCKQDFGSLMERLDKVEVVGGQFRPPNDA